MRWKFFGKHKDMYLKISEAKTVCPIFDLESISSVKKRITFGVEFVDEHNNREETPGWPHTLKWQSDTFSLVYSVLVPVQS